jgi:segregation and condensation protein B
MAFDLKRVLKVMLFASSGPLSVKDIQTAISRFHEQAEGLPLADAPTPDVEPASIDAAAPTEGLEVIAPETTGDDSMYLDVPSLITTAQIREAMDTLALELKAADSEVLLVEGSNGWRLVTHPRFARWVRLLRNEPPPVRLSASALETLAVISYRQPVTRADIEQIRGVSADAGITKLLERDLIYVVGRADLPGRPIQYGTTDTFLEFVGIKSLDELPASDVLTPRQLDSWLKTANEPSTTGDAAMGLDENEETQLSLEQAAPASVSQENLSTTP